MSYIDIIQRIFQNESIDDIVRNLINEYANISVEKTSLLLKQITAVSDIIIKEKNKQLIKSREALFWMICHYQTEKKNWNIGMLAPVCKEVFPKGCLDGHNGAEEKFFNEFIEFLKDKKNFDWQKDKDWAKQYEYWDWLCLVREKNM